MQPNNGYFKTGKQICHFHGAKMMFAMQIACLLLLGFSVGQTFQLLPGIYQKQFYHDHDGFTRGVDIKSLAVTSTFKELVADAAVTISYNGATLTYSALVHEPAALLQGRMANLSIVIKPERTQNAELAFLRDDAISTELSRQFSDVPMSTHVYISGPGSRALKPHTDGGDVFVYQLAGRKKWTICTPPCPSGYNCDGLSSAEQALMADVAKKHFDGQLP